MEPWFDTCGRSLLLCSPLRGHVLRLYTLYKLIGLLKEWTVVCFDRLICREKWLSVCLCVCACVRVSVSVRVEVREELACLLWDFVYFFRPFLHFSSTSRNWLFYLSQLLIILYILFTFRADCTRKAKILIWSVLKVSQNVLYPPFTSCMLTCLGKVS